jgi:hypothetical protein
MWTIVRKIRPTKIIIAFDNDESGNKAAEKLAPKLAKEGANVHRLKVPHGNDINEYVCLLAGKDKKAIPGILQGLFVDASVMQRADPGQFQAGEVPSIPVKDNASIDNSSLAANLAADNKIPPGAGLEAVQAVKEENRVEPDPGETDSIPNLAAEKQAAKEKNQSIPESQESAENTISFLAANKKSIDDNAATDLSVVKKGGDIEILIGDRSFRIRGLSKNQTFDVMRVNLRVMNPDGYHIDTLDLYNARHRTAYINTAALELKLTPEVIKKDLGRGIAKAGRAAGRTDQQNP